jgi:hypothetical protein
VKNKKIRDFIKNSRGFDGLMIIFYLLKDAGATVIF